MASRAAGGVLGHGETGVDADAGEEVAPHGCAGAFGGHQNDIHVLGGVDAGQVAIDPAEAVGEVERLAFGEMGLDAGPDGFERAVVDEHHDDGGFGAGFFDVEEGLAGFEAVLDGAFPVALETGVLADDAPDAVVAHVQRLGGALHAVADDGDDFILQNLARFFQREFRAGDDFFFDSTKINFGHNLSPSFCRNWQQTVETIGPRRFGRKRFVAGKGSFP